MYTVIRYNIGKDQYAMIIINRGLSKSLSGFITDGHLFKNGNHEKALLWKSSTYKEIKKMIINNLNHRDINVESQIEYSNMPLDRKRHLDLDIPGAYKLFSKEV